MRHCLERNNTLGFGAFTLVKTLDLRVIANREVSRFNKGPGQVLVAVFGVTPALALAIAQLLAIHTTTVRGKVTNLGKALDIARLQHDGHAQYQTDSIDREQLLKCRL